MKTNKFRIYDQDDLQQINEWRMHHHMESQERRTGLAVLAALFLILGLVGEYILPMDGYIAAGGFVLSAIQMVIRMFVGVGEHFE